MAGRTTAQERSLAGSDLEPAPSGSRLASDLWLRYRTSHDPEARARLLDSYVGLVHHAARALIGRGARSLNLLELVSAGTIGLIQALESFDPSLGTTFSTYAMPRIRGAMLDELRRQDWMPRGLREKRRKVDRARVALEMRLGRAPHHHEVAAELGLELRIYWRWVRNLESRVAVRLDDPGTGRGAPLAESLSDPAARDPIDTLLAREAMSAVQAAFETLSEVDRKVLTLYYFERLTLREIGQVLRVTESRVSQLRARAVRRLRERAEGRARPGTSPAAPGAPLRKAA